MIKSIGTIFLSTVFFVCGYGMETSLSLKENTSQTLNGRMALSASIYSKVASLDDLKNTILKNISAYAAAYAYFDAYQNLNDPIKLEPLLPKIQEALINDAYRFYADNSTQRHYYNLYFPEYNLVSQTYTFNNPISNLNLYSDKSIDGFNNQVSVVFDNPEKSITYTFRKDRVKELGIKTGSPACYVVDFKFKNASQFPKDKVIHAVVVHDDFYAANCSEIIKSDKQS
jgi:hypothetical protein